MIKTREWSMRVMYILIAVVLAISLMITGSPVQKVSANPGLSEWSRVSTPTTDGWVLAPDSVIIDYAVADGGQVAYAIVYMYDDGYYLLKSTDSAATWQNITAGLEAQLDEGQSITELLQVACDAVNPNFVAVAIEVYDGISTYSVHVYISDDGGLTFRDADEVEDGGVVLPASGVFDLAVSPEVVGKRDIAIGGYGSDGYSALFRCTVTADIASAWVDATTYDGWNDAGRPTAFNSTVLVDIQFSPDWAADKSVLVVTATDDTVYLQTGTRGETPGWNWKSVAGIDAVKIITAPYGFGTLGRLTAGITLPSDYSARNADTRYAWVWVNYYDNDGYPAGTIFRVKNNKADPIARQIKNGALWLSNVSYWGTIAEGKAIAGVLGDGTGGPTECGEGVQVYRNDSVHNMDICCLIWQKACKPPTGNYAMEAFYVSANKAYAVGLYDFDDYEEGAWSVSFDDGDIWNQLSLIDTHIEYLADVAVSPDCNKMMLLSVNHLAEGCGCDSVWLKATNLPEAEEYSGKWLRTWCGQLENNYGLLRLSPEETSGDTVYLVDCGTSTLYWNDMETLNCWTKRSAATVIDQIVNLAVKDESTIYALDADGNVAMSDDHGATASWTEAVDSKVDAGWTIAVHGDSVLVGGWGGDVSYSNDGGETFTALEDVASSGYVTVAFDTYFNQNDTIYAALAGAGDDNGIYRWVIGQSTEWENLAAEPYDYTGLVLDRPAPSNPMTSADTGGVLYASYIGGDTTGVARCLTPAEDVCCGSTGWDYLTTGLTSELFEMMPEALKICGCLTADSNSKLFAVDSSEPYDMENAETGTVWSFEDCYAKAAAPTLTSPADGAPISADPRKCVNAAFTLRWNRQGIAYIYDIQIALDDNFTEVVVNIQGYETRPGKAARYNVAKGTLPCGVTYYWRVRFAEVKTGQVIHSWWSEPWSFTVVQRKG
jgi:hypothetical protein